MLAKIWQLLRPIKEKYHLDYLMVLVLALILFSSLQGNYTLPEPDSFYHAKIAEFLSQGQIVHQFPWLQETYLAGEYVDHHFLYHLLLVPWVMLDDPLVGVKMATIIFASLTTLAVYWFFKKFKIPWPLFFVLILLTSRAWLWRASLVKAPVVFLLFLLLAYYFLTQKRWLDLTIISFLAVWLYGGWPVVMAMAIFYFIASWIFKIINKSRTNLVRDKQTENRLPWFGVIATFLGLTAGLIFNPYFPANLKFYWIQIVKIAIVNYQDVVRVGTEWHPFGFYNLYTYNSLVGALFVVGLILLIFSFNPARNGVSNGVDSLTWGLLSAAFLILTLKSSRNIEFFVPFTVIFFAFAFSGCYKNYLKVNFKELLANKNSLILIIILAVFVFNYFFQIPQSFISLKRDLLVGSPIDRYKNAALWLKENTPEKSVVFHSDWDNFPFLFYYNDRNYYLTGLDHTFMYENNRQKFLLYERIIRGEEKTTLAKKISKIFNAQYVFIQKNYVKFDENVKADELFQNVYEDEAITIYKINNND